MKYKIDTVRRGSHGPAVRRLQEFLDHIGEHYDTGSNDGIFGPDTELAVTRFQVDHKLVVDGICGPQTWRAVLSTVDHATPVPDPATLVDITHEHPRPRGFAYGRSLESILGVTVHQTGCEMPSNPSGWGRVNAHYGVTQEGVAIRINPITSMIWHAQRLSHMTIGVEVEGNHEGVLGDASTLWRGGGGPHYVSDRMVGAFDRIMADILTRVDPETITHIHGHRQSSATRRADPGSEIWKRCVLPWQNRLAATDGGPTWRTRKGRVIPYEWNPKYGGRY
jgi:hypothetical protein